LVKDNTDISDEVILTNIFAISKATAGAYFGAAMASTTPELRSMLSTALTQVMGEHAALTELSLKHEWVNPYISPSQQLAGVYKHSMEQKQ